MTMFDEARALLGTIQMCKTTQEELAERLGVSQSYVANKIRLLKYPEHLQKRIVENNLSERHARAVLRLSDNTERVRAIDEIARRHLNVAMSEALVEALYEKECERGESEQRYRAFDYANAMLRTCIDALSDEGYTAKKISEESDDGFKITLCFTRA